MDRRPDIVVTGIGLVTPVGQDLEQIFEALCTGRSGLVRTPEGHPAQGSLEVMGKGPDISAADVLPGPESRTLDRYIVHALVAAELAMADADLVVGRDVDPYRAATVVSGTGGLATLESQVVIRTQKGRLGVSPYLLPGMLPNMATARIAIKYDLRGYSSSIGTACAAGAQSIAEGMRILRNDEADVAIVGCGEAPLFPTLADTFGNTRALAKGWAEDPTAASRPFDRRRNGLVLAEGAGVFVLERAADADARGRAAYATLHGWGGTTDAHHPTTPRPDGEGQSVCMRRALADAGLTPADIGYLNAHATSTKLGDIAESLAVNAVFAGAMPPVSSNKGVTGHMLGASGVIEAAATVMAVGRGILPPTVNLEDPDPACDLDHIRGKARHNAITFALSNSFGFGGHNVSLVLGRPTTRLSRFGD
ncbi:beta-ketoacyl-[acyl-carrier-protein] synthase II [Catellatospora sp. TT07R-123]|uniref:beta-ketoacyl-[acyl-carrier-protein] synthase family protein n=1 Tax=Catellatospora sp. TT07R-123 TaxID=2733863 RepID=UPI001B01D3CC|nr:beta-ketoacyl-[acyl-carrier-protein] synthase family protein [Catellatospora sp. TT07R-123]GHJ45317.1 beta-ketoacyl-[acyl-carrier-protein] synthase II [Catellatospora sp. TT07R-123]